MSLSIKHLLIPSLSLLALTAIATPLAHAADTENPTEEPKIETKAEFDVIPGEITFDSAPDLDFGTFKVDQLIKGATSNAKPTTTPLSVTDYRGNNAGWVVKAQLTAFKPATSHVTTSQLTGSIVINNASLTANNTEQKSQFTKTPIVSGPDGQSYGSTVTVWTAGDDSGQGVNKATFGASDVALTTAANVHSEGKHYTAKLLWTLSATTEPTTPAEP